LSPRADLVPERTALARLSLEAKVATVMSYGVTVDGLADSVPIGAQRHATPGHRHLLRVAERVEQAGGAEQTMVSDGCPAKSDRLPPPDAPLTVGLEGGSVQAREAGSRTAGWCEVSVGHRMPHEGAAQGFGFVHPYDTTPKRRLVAGLTSPGRPANQQATGLSDGGDPGRELQL